MPALGYNLNDNICYCLSDYNILLVRHTEPRHVSCIVSCAAAESEKFRGVIRPSFLQMKKSFSQNRKFTLQSFEKTTPHDSIACNNSFIALTVPHITAEEFWPGPLFFLKFIYKTDSVYCGWQT